MTYRFRVSLPNIKGFARIYEVAPENSLYSFHKQMLADMDFPPDQTILFKGFDANGAIIGRYATFDIGDGSVDRTSIRKVIEAGIVQFVYFYDTINKKSVIITLEGEGSSKEKAPTLIESKGPNPEAFLNGYVAYEDLPPEKRRSPDEIDEDDEDNEDDIDCEEDDEDEEDEDFKEEYSEDEP